mmetsp:Transcript_6131/g.23169  ORF Transcript_6131/g.23169 Transcript_6131/m.23169 type:complete len:296 (+) Transcript_6131:253-1140(+)
MIAPWGGFKIAANVSTGNVPRLETLNDPPVYSLGFSRPSLARPASSLISSPIFVKDFVFALVTIGVINPEGVATATATSTVSQNLDCLLTAHQVALIFGDKARARLTAYITQSLTLALTFCVFSFFRNAATFVNRTSTDTYSCGLLVFDSSKRLAMTFLTAVVGMSSCAVSGSIPDGGGVGVVFGADCLPVRVGTDGSLLEGSLFELGASISPMAARTSPFTKTPFGPVPEIFVPSSPLSCSKRLTEGHKRPLGRVTWFLLEDVEDAGADDAEDDAIEASPSTLAPPSPVAGGAT